jgi:predicted transcriptional regulator
MAKFFGYRRKINNQVTKILKEFNIKNSEVITESDINYKRFESAVKTLINSSFDINSKNFDRFEVDITPRYLGYGPDIHITAVFKTSFSGDESDKAQNLRWDIIGNIRTFIPSLNNFDFGYRVSTEEVYKKYKIGYEELKKNKKITEELRSFNNSFLLTEAGKKKVLMDKLGLSETNAEYLDKKCGSLAVWIFNKILDLIISQRSRGSVPETATKEYIINEVINQSPNYLQINYNSVITSIMDWIRVGLNGNLGEYKNLSFVELRDESQKWHDSLEIGQGSINYVEPHTHDIILDFRENGEGFYWVDLNTNNSPEECDRMGHCGRTGYGNTIVSLREDRKIPGGKFKLNKSHLTASIGGGILYQLKGPKNSKPKDEYHNYIIPLFNVQDEEDGGYLIQGFGFEYASERDFKITDLPNQSIIEIYKERPDLFKSYGLKRKLRELGLIEEPDIDWVIEKFMKPSEVGDYVEGDWAVRTKKTKTPAGNTRTEYIYFIETLLDGDMWDIWSSYDIPWKDSLWYLDKESEHQIMEIIKRRIQSSDPDTPVEEDEELEDLIEGWDDDHEIRRCLGQAMDSAHQDAYYEYYMKELRDTLSEYGQVTQMNYDGVKITIDVSKFINDYRDEYIDEVMENCDEDPDCIFEEGIKNGDIDKPKLSVDDRYEASINERHFNEVFRDYLSEVK